MSFLDTVLPKGDPSTIADTRKCGRKNTLKRHAISSAYSWAACFTAFLARRCSRLMRFAMADRCQGPSVGSLIRDSSASIARPKLFSTWSARPSPSFTTAPSIDITVWNVLPPGSLAPQGTLSLTS